MGGLTRRTGAFVVATLVAASGCSLTIDTDEKQCEQTPDCAALGFPDTECVDSLCVAVDSAFACRTTPFPDPSTEMVDFSLSVVDLVPQTPYEGLTFEACQSLDPDCDNPIGTTTTDATGTFTISLQEGFLGHLFAPPPVADPMLAPLVAHIFPPPSNDPAIPVRAGLAVTELTTIAGLAMVAGETLVPGTGHIFFTAIDCQGAPLEGVAVSSSVQQAETAVAYLGASGQPDLNLLGTGASGQGAIISIPPGFVTIRGVHETEGLIFEQSVIIAADTITSVPIVPSPTP